MTEPPAKYLPTDDRKRAIAAAARSLIVEKGLEGLRTRAIADRVGINIATLHYHVPSKEALIELVAQSMRDEFHLQHQRHMRDGETPLERLTSEFRQFRETREDNPELLQVMDEMNRRARHDPNIARVIQPMRQFWLGQIADILADGVESGVFRSDLDPRSAAIMVIGTMIIGATEKSGSWAAFDAAMEELLRALLAPEHKVRDDV